MTGPTTDPKTGAKVYPCSSGHRHTVHARFLECEDRPSPEKSARALGFDKAPIHALARSIVQAILARPPTSGIRISAWKLALVHWLDGSTGVVEAGDWTYELGAMWALEVIAGFPRSDRRVQEAELRALALEAVLKRDDQGSLERIERRVRDLQNG